MRDHRYYTNPPDGLADLGGSNRVGGEPVSRSEQPWVSSTTPGTRQLLHQHLQKRKGEEV